MQKHDLTLKPQFQEVQYILLTLRYIFLLLLVGRICVNIQTGDNFLYSQVVMLGHTL